MLSPLVLSAVTDNNTNSVDLYAKSNDDKLENNDNGKKTDTTTENTNNDNLQVKDNAEAPEDEPHQVPTKAVVATSPITSDPSMVSVPAGKNCATNLSERPNPVQYLTYFNCGHVSKLQNGTTLRSSR